jgi:formiminotetrahydrofolate cyclodeaminase
VPIKMMQKAYEALLIHQRLLELELSMTLSDIGCGAAFLKAALVSAYFNIMINAKAIDDKMFFEKYEKEVKPLFEKGKQTADFILNQVINNLS